MLTYLDGTSSQRLGKGAQRFATVAVMADGALPIQIRARFSPGEIMYSREGVAPEDGGAMGHGKDARVDEAFQ